MDKSVPRGRLSGTITPPCSKSYAQRALAAALLAEGETVLRNLDFCDDTLSAIRVIETLAITDRTYLLYEGKILKTGTAEELAADEMVRRVYLGKNFELKKNHKFELTEE